MAEYDNNAKNSVNSADFEEQGLQLADIWEMIWNNRWWYVISVAICLFAALIYLYKTPKTFSRSEKVILDERTEQSTIRNLTQFSGGYAAGFSSATVYNEMEAFASPDLMERVVERLGFETKYIEDQFMRKRELYTNAPFQLVLTGDNTASSFDFIAHKQKDGFKLTDFVVGGVEIGGESITGAFGDTLDTPVGNMVLVATKYANKFDKDIEVSWRNAKTRAKSYCGNLSVGLSNKQSSVISLTQKDYFPARAERILSTLLDIYNENWLEGKNKSATNTAEFIDERLAIIEKELGGIEGEIKSFRQETTSLMQVR